MPSATPRISVLMPVYNAQRFVVDAVRSILCQTFEDFEFLVLDDGSTDDSPGLIQAAAGGDPRLRFASRPNGGIVSALNQMLAVARGELVARMDADDVALPHRLQEQVRFLEAHPRVACVGGGVELIDEEGRPLMHPAPVRGDAAVQRVALGGRIPICHPTALFRAEPVRRIGAYRPWAFPAEDLDLWLRLGEVGELDNLDQCVLKYRLHPCSISASQAQWQMAQMQAVCRAAWARRRIRGTFHGPFEVESGRTSPSCDHPLLQSPAARALVMGSRGVVAAPPAQTLAVGTG